jgi:hypothetical protein
MPFVYLLPKTFVLIGFKTFDEGYFRNESCALSSIYTSFCPLCSTCLYFLCSTYLYFLCSTCLYFLCTTCLYFFLSFMFDMPLLGVYKITASSYSLWCLQTFVYDTYYNLTIICHVYRTLILSVDYLYNIFIT